MSKHPVVHFEITAQDGDGLKKFYTEAFGWPIDSNNQHAYGMVEAGGMEQPGRINGGISATMDGGPGYATIYIQVANLEQALEVIEKAGGETLVPPTQIEGGSRIAHFKDIGGNRVGLYEAES